MKEVAASRNYENGGEYEGKQIEGGEIEIPISDLCWLLSQNMYSG